MFQIDSVAAQIGSEMGLTIGSYLAIGLGFLNKFITSGALKALELKFKLPSTVQAIIAWVFAQGIVIASTKLNIPIVSANLDQLPLIGTGLLVWAVSMGWHGLAKALLKDASAQSTTPTT